MVRKIRAKLVLQSAYGQKLMALDADSTGPQLQALADAAILFGPVEYAARQVAETQPD